MCGVVCGVCGGVCGGVCLLGVCIGSHSMSYDKSAAHPYASTRCGPPGKPTRRTARTVRHVGMEGYGYNRVPWTTHGPAQPSQWPLGTPTSGGLTTIREDDPCPPVHLGPLPLMLLAIKQAPGPNWPRRHAPGPSDAIHPAGTCWFCYPDHRAAGSIISRADTHVPTHATSGGCGGVGGGVGGGVCGGVCV